MLQPWRTLASRPVLDRRPWLNVWEEDVLLPNGRVIEGYLRAESRDYAMTFAVLEDGTVPLVQQYKQGIGGPMFDLPAGYLDTEHEDPLAAAQRELREETGLIAAEWKALGSYLVDTNRGATRAHLFLATGAHPVCAQELDETEAIEVTYHTPSTLRQMVQSGTIDSLASAAAIALALLEVAQS